MNAPCVDFLFDYISPKAYLAWRAIHELAGRHGRSVRPTPVLYAALESWSRVRPSADRRAARGGS